MNIAQLLERAATAHPERLALVHGETRASFALLRERVARLAGYLRSCGLARGDRVAVLQRNGPSLLESMLAAFHGGFCAVPMNARLTTNEAAEIVSDAAIAAVIYAPEYAEHVRPTGREHGFTRVCLGVDREADVTFQDAINQASPIACEHVPPTALAWLFYTSGTTGRPKGAMLTHRNLLTMTLGYIADIRALEPDSIVLHAAPLTHGSGLYALPALARGVTQALTTSRSYAPEEVLRLVAELGVTDIAFLAPTMVKWLTEAQVRIGSNTGSLRNIVYGGGPMYQDDLLAAMHRFGPVFSQIYGQAEAPMTITRLRRDEHDPAGSADHQRLLSAGRAYTVSEVGVAQGDGTISLNGDGEIIVRGDAIMKGYWNDVEATAVTLRDGWLHTGDLGSIGPDGFVYLLDRSKDVIVSGGTNVYPREIEEIILAHPAIRQVAVVGAPDDAWGERIVSILVIDGIADRAEVEAEIEGMCRERLSGYKVPREFDWRDELPTNSYGKVLKRELRAGYWEGRPRAI